MNSTGKSGFALYRNGDLEAEFDTLLAAVREINRREGRPSDLAPAAIDQSRMEEVGQEWHFDGEPAIEDGYSVPRRWVISHIERPLDETNAAEYVETAARGTIAHIGRLIEVAEGRDELDDAELEAIDLPPRTDPGHSEDALRERAEEQLTEWPLAVEATTTFEVVLGTGGPDRRLCFECTMVPSMAPEFNPMGIPEIRRVLYRYSWSGSAEVELLLGGDRETAEAFGRRVVPELADA